MGKSWKYHYACNDCGNHYDPDEVTYLCPDCSRKNKPGQPPFGVLKTMYRFPAGSKPSYEALARAGFIPLMPFDRMASLPPLRIGATPLYGVTWEEQGRKNHLWLKDDSQNPTYSFKDRASGTVSACCREKGIQTIVTASTGNAGSSMACVAASQTQKAIVVVPASSPPAKLTQIILYGAQLIPVAGTYDDAFDFSIRISEHFGFYNRNTAFNPLTIEGKKTVSFELFGQMGKTPDRIFVPVGDGVIISGVYKGFEDLLHLGIAGKMPHITAVQAKGSDNLARNLDTETFRNVKSRTIADSISVDVPRNFRMARKYLQTYGGDCITVGDEEILAASAALASSYGLFAEPAAAAAFAGFLSHVRSGKGHDKEKVVVLLTGSGLKDVEPLKGRLAIMEPVIPDLAVIEKLIQGKQ
jgi:threonine synthase